MVARSSLVAIAATLALAAPSAAMPVGDPVQVSFGSISGLLFNPTDGVFVVSSSFIGYPEAGYVGAAVPRQGAITARPLFREGNAPSGGVVVAHNPDRNEYLVLVNIDAPLPGVIYAGDGRRLRDVTISDAPGNAVAAVYNPARGEFLIAFRPLGAATSASLMVQRIDATGARVAAANVVSDRPEVTGVLSVDLAYRPRFDDYVAVWDGVRADGSIDVYAQRLDADGRELGTSDMRVSDHRNLHGRDANQGAAVAQSDGRSALVVWSDGHEIYGRRLKGRGARPAGEQVRHSPPGDARRWAGTPDVAFHEDARGYLVVWSATVHRVFPGGFEAFPGVVFGRHVRRDGLASREFPFEVSPAALPDPESAEEPAVAADPEGDYLATWELRGCCSRTASVFARRVAPQFPEPDDPEGVRHARGGR
jgi:hypothetical protein